MNGDISLINYLYINILIDGTIVQVKLDSDIVVLPYVFLAFWYNGSLSVHENAPTECSYGWMNESGINKNLGRLVLNGSSLKLDPLLVVLDIDEVISFNGIYLVEYSKDE